MDQPTPDLTAPGLRRFSKALRAIGFSIGAGCFAALLNVLVCSGGVHVPGGVRTVLDDTLPAPSTTKYVSYEERAAEFGWFIGFVVLDSQNEHGAMIRHRLCVTWHEDGDMVNWNKRAGVYECNDRPDERLIANLKEWNHWRK